MFRFVTKKSGWGEDGREGFWGVMKGGGGEEKGRRKGGGDGI